MAAEDGLKAQKLLAQGIALGNVGKKQSRPERAKALKLKAFALSGRLFCICYKTQGDALLLPFQGVLTVTYDTPSSFYIITTKCLIGYETASQASSADSLRYT